MTGPTDDADDAPATDGRAETEAARGRRLRERADRRRRRDAIFGDELPEQAPAAPGDERGRDADILRDVPPHHS